MREISEQHKKLFSIMGIPSLFWGREVVDILAGDDVAKFIQNYVDDPAPKLEEGLGFFISGAMGSGKTTASAVFLMEPIYRGQITHARFLEAPALMSMVFDEPELLLYYKKRKILVLDDFGREYRKNTEYVAKLYEDFIRYRMTHKLVTGITSNLSLEEIEKAYGAGVAYLIEHSCVVFNAQGMNRRDNTQPRLRKLAGL